MALEQDSPSVWAQFEALQKAHEAGFDTTQPAPRPHPQTTTFAPTQPMAVLSAPKVPKAAAGRTVTLDEAMVMARRNNRACPVPAQWVAFHKLLPVRAAENGRTLAPPPPVDGAAWAGTSPMQKRLRLRDQIEWAERTGALEAAYQFLVALPEDQWHHFSD